MLLLHLWLHLLLLLHLLLHLLLRLELLRLELLGRHLRLRRHLRL